MVKNMKKNKVWLVVSSLSFFALFYAVPLIFSSMDFFTKDFMWHVLYMIVVYSLLSGLFLFVAFKIFRPAKKIIFLLVGLIFLSYLISAVYVFIRLNMVLTNPRFMSW